MSHNCSLPVTSEGVYPFDARGVAKRFRHAAIFGALDSLQPGETMRFCNDHDPPCHCCRKSMRASAPMWPSPMSSASRARP